MPPEAIGAIDLWRSTAGRWGDGDSGGDLAWSVDDLHTVPLPRGAHIHKGRLRLRDELPFEASRCRRACVQGEVIVERGEGEEAPTWVSVVQGSDVSVVVLITTRCAHHDGGHALGAVRWE